MLIKILTITTRLSEVIEITKCIKWVSCKYHEILTISQNITKVFSFFEVNINPF